MSNILIVAFALFTALGPGELPEYVPAGSEAYSLDLQVDGYRNGRMDPDRMMTVRGCTLERDAAYLYALMLDAADEDGVYLTHEDCYRSYNEQFRAYERSCPLVEQPTYGVDPASGQTVQTGSRRVRECSGAPVAPAGRSNHGWGRAVDFADRGGVLTCYDEAFHWLKANAHRYGWVHPAWAQCGRPTQEPWHWEWAGVTDPITIKTSLLDPALVPTLE